MAKRRIGRSDIAIEPFVLGTNVFGWTADEPTSFAVLDAFVGQGFSAIDTADVYSRWIPGNDSESEKIIGRWMKARGNRDKIILATKVGSDMGQGRKDLRATWIVKAVEGSLLRLQTDYIDLYQSHWPDAQTPEEETLGAYDRLVKAGKVRIIGASNYDEKLLANSLNLSVINGLPRYQCIQNEFNLYTRGKYEGAVQELVIKEGLSAITIYDRPATMYVAEFVGSPAMNLIHVQGQLAQGAKSIEISGARVVIPETREAALNGSFVLGARPEHIRFDDKSKFRGEIFGTEYLGTTQIVTVDIAQGKLKARVPANLRVKVGEQVGLTFMGDKLSVFNKASSHAIKTALHEGVAQG